MLLQEMIELAKAAGTDKWEHSYMPFYHGHFAQKRSDVRKVLEIGLGDTPGGRSSLYLWRDYFPYATIYGADSEIDKLVQSDRIKTTVCDQTDEDQLKRLTGFLPDDFDLIIDDGCHEQKAQELTARILLSLLSPTGIYVVEDVNEFDYIPGYQSQTLTFNGPGDRLVIIRK